MAANQGPAVSGPDTWKLEDAKARFSELVRRAQRGIPQHVSVRGQNAVVVLSAADYARLVPTASSVTLAALFADSPLARLDELDAGLVRERGTVREAPVLEK
jgi:antitoxin Phd